MHLTDIGGLSFIWLDVDILWFKHFLARSHPGIGFSEMTLFGLRLHEKLRDHEFWFFEVLTSLVSFCQISSILSFDLGLIGLILCRFSCTFTKSLVILQIGFISLGKSLRMLDLPDFRGLIPGVRLTDLRGHMADKEVQVKTFIFVAILSYLSLLVLPNG